MAVLQWPWVSAELPGEGLYSCAGASCRKVTDWSAQDSFTPAGGDKCSHQQASRVQTSCSLGRISEDFAEAMGLCPANAECLVLTETVFFFLLVSRSSGRRMTWTAIATSSPSPRMGGLFHGL